ncbi:type 1 periplasmic binding fold superfamily protein [Flavobacterium sp. 7A]|uniref:type 1 periplasmic binding fold superfamily protein n=1 Tax=Flavobacterium sp. 7A TaxID=2940571 RepID=UPI0029CAC68C|nr:type 1 periplasmic binding fold superfamily protein [Flavobacterium sp. 7A]MCW2119308.1 hypothetical protein [Flavobacterium sp. 7A]
MKINLNTQTMTTTMKNSQKSTMKNFKTLALAVIATLTISSCSNDDEPVPVNEEELITTVIATYTPVGGGTAVTLQYKDLDGEGANAPVVTVSGPFAKNTTYNGAVTFKNELANPVDDITLEIIEEGVDHQLFYQKTGTLNAFTYGTATSNFDANGKPVGLQSVFTTTNDATGNLTITLRHEPNKSATNVATGDITNAGGSTDAEVTFAITVQ